MRIFVEHVIQRYKLLRQSVLSEESLLTFIDETQQYLGPAIDEILKSGVIRLTVHQLEADSDLAGWQSGKA